MVNEVFWNEKLGFGISETGCLELLADQGEMVLINSDSELLPVTGEPRQLRSLLSKLFFDPAHMRSHLGSLENACRDFEKWISDVEQSSLGKVLQQPDMTADQLVDYLMPQGRAFQKNDFKKLPPLLNYAAHRLYHFHHHPRMDHIRELAAFFEPLLDVKPAIARRYLHMVSFDLDDFFGENKQIFYIVGHSHLGDHLIFHGHEAHHIFERWKSVQKNLHYLETADFDLLPALGLNAIEGIKFLAESMSALKGYQRSDIKRLLKHSSEPLTVFRKLANTPALLDLYTELRRGSFREASYPEFVLAEESMLTTSGERKLLLTIFYELIKDPTRRNAVIQLYEHRNQLLFDKNAGVLIEMITKNPNTSVLVKDYFGAEDEPRKQELLLQIGGFKMDDQTLKLLRSQVAGQTEESLDWVTGRLTYNEIASRIRKPTTTSATKTKKSWYQTLEESIGAAPIEHRQLVQRAYHMLGSYQDRLRNIWLTQSETLIDFCTDVVTLGTGFVPYLANSAKFDDYKQLLIKFDGSDYEEFRRTLTIKKGNEPSSPDLIKQTAREEAAARQYFCDRLHVYGWEYSCEAKERITAGAPEGVEVIFHQGQSSFADFSGLGVQDLVVAVTGGMAHVDYNTLRNHCTRRGIAFHHFNTKGSSSLIELMKNVRKNPDRLYTK